MVVFLISSTSCPLTPLSLPPPILSSSQKKKMNRNQPQRTFKMGGRVVWNHFSILMNNKHQQPSPRKVYFYAKSAQGKHFQPYCIIWPKTFFLLPYCSSTCNKIHIKEKQSLREDVVLTWKGVAGKAIGPAHLWKLAPSESPQEWLGPTPRARRSLASCQNGIQSWPHKARIKCSAWISFIMNRNYEFETISCNISWKGCVSCIKKPTPNSVQWWFSISSKHWVPFREMDFIFTKTSRLQWEADGPIWEGLRIISSDSNSLLFSSTWLHLVLTAIPPMK